MIKRPIVIGDQWLEQAQNGDLLEFPAHFGPINVATWSSTVTIDASLSDRFTITLGGNTVIDVVNGQPGQVLWIEIIQDAGASGYTVTWPTTTSASNGITPTLSLGSNERDVFNLMIRGTNSYDLFQAGQTLSPI